MTEEMPTTKIYDLGLRGILAGLAGHAKEKSPLYSVFCTLCHSASTQHPYSEFISVSKIPHLWCQA